VPCDTLFSKYAQDVVNTYLKDRTGILNPDATVRGLATNVLVLLSWAGLFELLLP